MEPGYGKCSRCPTVGELGDGLCQECSDKTTPRQTRRRQGYSMHLSRTPKNRRINDTAPTSSSPGTSPSTDNPSDPEHVSGDSS